jgi:excinuclease UvrABC nuclease subunit
MTQQDFKKIAEKLPDLPGVYFFLGSKKEILYIGKATSLRDRVKSYFSKDIIVTRGALVQQMILDAKTIDFQVTDSMLEALILENNLIKKYQPHANTREKDDKSFNHVIVTREKFPQVLLMRGKNVGKEIHLQFIKYDFGPYPQGSQLKEALRIVRKIFPFRDARCVSAAEQIARGKTPRPCFNRQIGLCPGVCTGEISEKEYGRTVNHIRLFFEGKKKALIKSLEKEMALYAKNRQFEKAGEIKRTLFALSHIQDVSLIKADYKDAEYVAGAPSKSEKPFRIEAYDISHLSGQNMTGAMVVLEDGEFNKAEYRKFKIKTVDRSNDIGALSEVLKRRFAHLEWAMPDVVVVDGNEAQKRAAEDVFKELVEKKLPGASAVSVVAVVKNQRHKPHALIGKADIVDHYQKEILLANNEAHRFVIAYHKKLRSDFLH